ncbi:MAG: ABC transporter permease [Verrucomicrobiota bacterium]
MIETLGRTTLAVAGELGDFTLFAGRSLASAVGSRKLGRRIMRALYEQGVRCLPVILIVGVFTGLVLGLQGYYVLSRYGSTSVLGELVSLTLVRELAPVLAALMLVGQAGSALAAELGIQRNSEQIDALETMGASPHAYLIAPRVIAAAVSFPVQTAFFSLIGIWGGYLSGSLLLPLQGGIYWASVHDAVKWTDLRECFLKAFVFGVLTITICAHNGYNTHRRTRATGARAVSASTTRAVVVSCIAVLAADYIITSLLVRL